MNMKILNCRRSLIAILAIGCLTYLGVHNNIDVSMALASVAIGLAGANSAQNIYSGKKGKE